MNQRKRWLQLYFRIQARVKAPLDFPLTLEQLEYIIQSIDRNSYLEACPGSGKTEVVGIKAASVIRQWTQPFSGIAVLSFTQNAASEICQRISRYSGLNGANNPHFAGTFDSWLHQYILQPFGAKEMNYSGKEGDKRIRIVESDSHAYFLRNYSTVVNLAGKNGRKEIWVNRYSITPEGQIEECVEGALTGISRVDLNSCMRNKLAFFAAGFATYQDCSYIAYKVLTGNSSIAERVTQRFPCIFVDECQDLCRNQLAVLYRLMKKGCKVHLVGDPNQSIYEFRKVDPIHLKGFIENVEPILPKLTRNHRSNQAIVNVCNNLVGSVGTLQGNSIPAGAVPVLLWQYSPKQIPDLPGLFIRILSNQNIDPDKSAIIVRGKTLLTKLNNSKSIPEGHTAKAANAIGLWYRQGRNVAQMTSALEQFGSVLCHVAFEEHGKKQCQHCPDYFDPVEWRYLLHKLLCNARQVYKEMTGSPRPNWKYFASTIRDYFETVWQYLPAGAIEWSVAKKRFNAPKNCGTDPVEVNQQERTSTNSVRMSTIHDIKGESLDAAMLVSSPTKQGDKGGHFSSWLDPAAGDEEYTRFAYVACSRPRHLLVVATPRLEEVYLKKFRQLGFAPEDIPE